MKSKKHKKPATHDGKIFTVLSYCSFLCIVPLLARSYPKIHFRDQRAVLAPRSRLLMANHIGYFGIASKQNNEFLLSPGQQGLVLFVAQMALFISCIVLGTKILHLGFLILLFFSLWGIVESLKGRYVKFPFEAGLADKIVL